MDKENIKGAAQKIKGKIEEVAGKVLGDRDLELHGKADQLGGAVRGDLGLSYAYGSPIGPLTRIRSPDRM